jgi:hypothetical protein
VLIYLLERLIVDRAPRPATDRGAATTTAYADLSA